MDEEQQNVTPEEELEPQETEQEQPEEQEEPQEEPVEEEPKEETPEEPEEEEPKPLSPRQQKRLEKLLEKISGNDSARYQPKNSNQPKFTPITEGEYDVDQINQMAASAFNQGLSRAEAIANATNFNTRLEIDVPRVASKYEFLDQESDKFDPGAADFINRMYLNTVGYDPSTGAVANNGVRYSEFVEGMMEMMDTLNAGKASESVKNVARQAAQTGVRPGGSSTRSPYKGGNPNRMTDDQLDKAIAEGLGLK